MSGGKQTLEEFLEGSYFFQLNKQCRIAREEELQGGNSYFLSLGGSQQRKLNKAFQLLLMESGIISKWFWRLFAICLQCKKKKKNPLGLCNHKNHGQGGNYQV
jgi:hypothetical protein